MWENIVIQSTGESSSTYFYVKSLMYSYILPMTQNINGSHHHFFFLSDVESESDSSDFFFSVGLVIFMVCRRTLGWVTSLLYRNSEIVSWNFFGISFFQNERKLSVDDYFEVIITFYLGPRLTSRQIQLLGLFYSNFMRNCDQRVEVSK